MLTYKEEVARRLLMISQMPMLIHAASDRRSNRPFFSKRDIKVGVLRVRLTTYG
jgi:hypothetical protein